MGEREHRAVDYIPVDSPELLDIDVLFPPCILKYERAPGVGRGSSSRCSCDLSTQLPFCRNRSEPDTDFQFILPWNPPPRRMNDLTKQVQGLLNPVRFNSFPLYIPCLPLPHSLPLSLLPPSSGARTEKRPGTSSWKMKVRYPSVELPPPTPLRSHYPHLC